MTHFSQKHTLIFGTMILTAAGFLTRILGFFYRIFLSRTIGAEGLGIYQMIFPIYGICFSLCAGSIQTAISRFTAAKRTEARRILFVGFLISFSLSLLLSFVIWTQADFLALHILLEPQCAPLLPALALAIPCTSIHSCISGYYYGKEKVQIPAAAQLFEQCIRIFSVFLFVDICHQEGRPVTVQIAVMGLFTGEAASALFSMLMFVLFSVPEHTSVKPALSPGDAHIPSGNMYEQKDSLRSTFSSLMTLAFPLMANRLVLNLLQSAEAIMIPNRLTLFGHTSSQAISMYGVLTGMAIPFILFPSAIVNSLAVVLLPSVARYQSDGNTSGIRKSISLSLRYSLYMGILCIGIFSTFGDALGMTVFQNQNAGSFICILSWLCPFLYLATTMGSILNGLGKTSLTFLNNLISLSIRLLFLFFGIPKLGILAVLWGMLVSEILLAFLHLKSLHQLTKFSLNAREVILKPSVCLLLSLGIDRLFPDTASFALPFVSVIPESAVPFLFIGLRILLICLVYGLSLLLFHQK